MRLPGFILFSALLLLLTTQQLAAQDGYSTRLALGDVREIVVDIDAGFGTFYLKRSEKPALFTLREKDHEDREEYSQPETEYYIEDGIGYLTVDLTNGDDGDMNALACLIQGKQSRIWYATISDGIPVRLDITLGAGTAALNLTGIHIRAFSLDAGAGTVRINVDKANREEIEDVAISAGVGSVTTKRLGNLRFQTLDFEGGMGTYRLDCSGALPRKSRIHTDVGVGSLTLVLPKGVGAKALTNDHFLSSTKMYRFIQHSDDVYITPDYKKSKRRVLLDLQSGVGSVSVRWAK
ncbi:MAG: hypothetical protein C0600_14260 [Ignavibacteria bacterium]|nr:MAG: hypothetical protein C0600_14260 [Ignavibacteria bacterium]